MTHQAAVSADSNVHKIQQAVKWSVYTLLIINFVFYVFEDWNRAVHTLHAGSTLLDWTSELSMSAIDGDPPHPPGYHIYVGPEAAWHEITDDLEQYDTEPPE